MPAWEVFEQIIVMRKVTARSVNKATHQSSPFTNEIMLTTLLQSLLNVFFLLRKTWNFQDYFLDH